MKQCLKQNFLKLQLLNVQQNYKNTKLFISEKLIKKLRILKIVYQNLIYKIKSLTKPKYTTYYTRSPTRYKFS